MSERNIRGHGTLYTTLSTRQKPQEVAIALLGINSVHLVQQAYPGPAFACPGPKGYRPRVVVGVSEEQRNVFSRRWVAFALGSGIDPHNLSSQLFHGADGELGNGLLKSDPGIIIKPTGELMAAMTAMAVIAVATAAKTRRLFPVVYITCTRSDICACLLLRPMCLSGSNRCQLHNK